MPLPRPAPIQQQQAPQPPHITRKPLTAAAAAQPSVLARELGDNTRTYLPGVREADISVGNNNNNSNVNNANPSGPLAAAAVVALAPSALGRELGDNTRTYLQGVWETGDSSGPPQRGNGTVQGRQRAPAAAAPAPTVLNRSIGDMSRTNIPMVREVDGTAEYDADIDAVGRHVNRNQYVLFWPFSNSFFTFLLGLYYIVLCQVSSLLTLTSCARLITLIPQASCSLHTFN